MLVTKPWRGCSTCRTFITQVIWVTKWMGLLKKCLHSGHRYLSAKRAVGSQMILVHEKGYSRNVNNYKNIVFFLFFSVILKIFTHDLLKVVEEVGFSVWQGFKDAIFLLSAVVNIDLKIRLFVDLKLVFDSVPDS